MLLHTSTIYTQFAIPRKPRAALGAKTGWSKLMRANEYKLVVTYFLHRNVLNLMSLSKIK